MVSIASVVIRHHTHQHAHRTCGHHTAGNITISTTTHKQSFTTMGTVAIATAMAMTATAANTMPSTLTINHHAPAPFPARA